VSEEYQDKKISGQTYNKTYYNITERKYTLPYVIPYCDKHYNENKTLDGLNNRITDVTDKIALITGGIVVLIFFVYILVKAIINDGIPFLSILLPAIVGIALFAVFWRGLYHLGKKVMSKKYPGLKYYGKHLGVKDLSLRPQANINAAPTLNVICEFYSEKFAKEFKQLNTTK